MGKYFGTYTNGSGPMLWFICKAMQCGEPKRVELLTAELQPAPFVDSSPDKIANLALSQSLSLAVEIGLLEKAGRKPNVSYTLRIPQADVDSPDAFRTTIRRLILAGTPGTDGNNAFGDLPLVLAWLMGSSLEYPFPTSWDDGSEERIRRHKMIGQVLNSTQWSGAIHWAEFLGFVTQYRVAKKGIVVPDPRTAVLDEIRSFPKKLNGTEFAKRLSEALPVFTGGSVEQQLSSSTASRETDSAQETRFSPVESHALLTLERSGKLKFKQLDDGKNRVSLSTPSGPRVVDQVEVKW